MLRIFDLETSIWKEIRFERGGMPSYGATVHDHKTGRFYLIGGQVGGQGVVRKSKSIIWYSR